MNKADGASLAFSRLADTVGAMEITGCQLIAGQASALSDSTFSAVNPATGQALSPSFHEATRQEVDRAGAAASEAAGVLRRKLPAEKARLLRAIADRILALGETLVMRATEETGLPRGRIEMERGRTCNQLRMFAEVVEQGAWVDARMDRALPERQPLPRPDLRRMLVALGPVAVFGASNFPLAFSVGGGDTASALAAGCPVVCKGHPAHPGTSELVARAISQTVAECGFPAGMFSLVQGTGAEVGLQLVRHPVIRAVGFTGSLKAGRALFDEAARRPEPIPVYAEMGSTNPVFILPGALRQGAQKLADGLFASMTLGVGQFCTKPGMVVLPDGPGMGVQEPAQQWLDLLAGLVESAAPGVMLHAGIRAAFVAGARRLGGMPGVQVLGTGEAAEGEAAGCSQRPMLFRTTAADLVANPAIAEEVFGPATLVVSAGTRAEMLAAARSLQGHLTATIHGTPEDLEQWRDLVEILETKAGRILFNSWPTGVEVSPAMQHGGPYPATTDVRSTSVGTAAILRWVRPVCWQNFPDAALPPELQDSNPLKIARMVNGCMER